jgi:hypothetical protein
LKEVKIPEECSYENRFYYNESESGRNTFDKGCNVTRDYKF